MKLQETKKIYDSILRIAKNNLPGVMAVTLSTVRAALLKP